MNSRWNHLPDREGHLFVGVAIIIAAIIITMLASVAWGVTPIDPNSLPFATDANAYTAPIAYWCEGAPHAPLLFETTVRNKGGWDVDLTITMADGSPTSVFVEASTARPIRDPNAGGFRKIFIWSWTPPAEGVFYLQARASTKGKPAWRGDVATVVLYCYGEDIPQLEFPDPPVISIAADLQRNWHKLRKWSTPLRAQLLQRGLLVELTPTKSPR